MTKVKDLWSRYDKTNKGPFSYVYYLRAKTVQLETNIEGINDRFEIDIFMWAIGTQSQDGRSQ